jgi:DNA-binding MarR family transcriptional regulator
MFMDHKYIFMKGTWQSILQDDKRYQLMASYRELYLELKSMISECAHECDLSLNEFLILKFLSENTNSSLNELSNSLHFAPSQCSIWVDNLTKRGLVHRVRDDVDRRRLFLRATTEGQSKLRNLLGAKADFQAYVDEVFDLSDSEIEMVIRLNRRIIESLKHRRGSEQ